MAKDQDSHDMDFLLGNHSWGPPNFDNLGESKENMKPPNQKKEGKDLMNKRNQEITSENEKKIITSGEGSDGKYLESDREMHLSIERERRKKMKDMFSSLHALLPQLPPKADKSTIVNEAVNYIKDLQQTREKLEKQKQERLQCVSVPVQQQVAFDKTWASPNMVLNICGEEAHFCMYSAHKPGLMTTIASVLEKHKIEVISASMSCNDNGNGNTCMIQVHGKQDANSVEETYKQAAEEILLGIV
ncbi:Transcription factor bHLH95 [Spatholobus suberectus]|nr:Transcription factor bHLH95 [Spatholobus suberectus]